MIGYYNLSLGFDEDQLPQGQNPIVTASVKRFQVFVEFIMQSKQKTGYSTMGIVIGLSGIGKTIAIQAFLQGQELRPHIGLPACIGIKVIPGSTPKTLLDDILISLGERPRNLSTHRSKIAKEAAEAIMNNDVKVLFVDDADLLSVDCFEFLRYIFCKTGCPIVIVGLRRIWQVVNLYEKFSSRIGLRHDFFPPDEKEVLETILPQMIFPHWSFNPSHESDLVMGKELWRWVGPSFRNLRTVIEYASQFAELQGQEHITLATLKQSYQMTPIPMRQVALGEEETEEPQTKYEDTSVLRQQAREAKNQKESA